MSQDKDKKEKKDKTEPVPPSTGSTGQEALPKIKKNPNPRANANVHEKELGDKTDPDQTSGVGTEITDGEDG